jgi:hypothetical protein
MAVGQTNYFRSKIQFRNERNVVTILFQDQFGLPFHANLSICGQLV